MCPPIWDLFLSISCTFYLKTGCAPPHLWQNSAPSFGKSWIRHWSSSFWFSSDVFLHWNQWVRLSIYCVQKFYFEQTTKMARKWHYPKRTIIKRIGLLETSTKGTKKLPQISSTKYYQNTIGLLFFVISLLQIMNKNMLNFLFDLMSITFYEDAGLKRLNQSHSSANVASN